MAAARSIAWREIKITFRSPWAYSFMALYALFLASLLLIQSQNMVQGYSGTTGTMIHLSLYLLPLMVMVMGAFALAVEREDGNWELLSVYPLKTTSYILGKYVGIVISLLAISAVAFGLSGLIGALGGQGFDLSTFGWLLFFACSLVILFAAISMVIGAVAANRWQALSGAVGLWFFLIIAWPTLLIAVLGKLPYVWIKPLLSVATLLNPAELSRLFLVIKLEGGSIIGPEYYEWITLARSSLGLWIFAGIALLWVVAACGVAILIWNRRRWHA